MMFPDPPRTWWAHALEYVEPRRQRVVVPHIAGYTTSYDAASGTFMALRRETVPVEAISVGCFVRISACDVSALRDSTASNEAWIAAWATGQAIT
ncbi:hypothetical protein [Nonomuraea sp. NPDC050202]|uniref:hypothetical protein n=1 Tax=Nonomuraea sp. NPDC050202 TaxID=3155035 RepID=UPI0033EE67BB